MSIVLALIDQTMPKSLGQIHTVNHESVITSAGSKDQIDLSGELSKQLQHHVRQGNYFKVVGIDMNLTENGGNQGGVQMTGFLDYYIPTRGRCEAYRGAFAAMRTAMKNQGIPMSRNSAYDFRVNSTKETFVNSLKNAATLDGTNTLHLEESGTPQSIFEVHNNSLDPLQTGTPTFSSGFNTLGTQGAPTDFVLNEGDIGFTGNTNFASSEFESIPFQLSYTPSSTDISVSLQWRPDPALYIAVMCGLFRIRVDELDYDGDADQAKLTIAVHVAGWKSIMGSPDAKKRIGKKAAKPSMKSTTTTTTVKKS